MVPAVSCESHRRKGASEDTDDEGGSGCAFLLSDTHGCAVPILPETDDNRGHNEVVEVFS